MLDPAVLLNPAAPRTGRGKLIRSVGSTAHRRLGGIDVDFLRMCKDEQEEEKRGEMIGLYIQSDEESLNQRGKGERVDNRPITGQRTL